MKTLQLAAAGALAVTAMFSSGTLTGAIAAAHADCGWLDGVATLGVSCLVTGLDTDGSRPSCPPGWVDMGLRQDPDGLKLLCYDPNSEPVQTDAQARVGMTCPDGTFVDTSQETELPKKSVVCAGHGYPQNPPDSPPKHEGPCPEGYEEWNGECPRPCPEGKEHRPNGQCACPDGTEEYGGQCLPPCPDGQPRRWGSGCADPQPPDTPPEAPKFHGCQWFPLPPVRTPIDVPCQFGQIDTGPMP
ncbi:hypothetical protein H7J07_09590 [Mycobacterium koreense]|uniref:hypothetical protein n=1 Tax=Mycolicibacillus koreensis TaxID=1069220 RepID=UPI000D6A7D4B|nr:hypothetical protein [Mycolicibacillus koreensis]MCV7248464.1 hypothetical protein [Mycolicibacillus koreensis]BBY55420.1 hypothetical protein MKOR_26710 [Mycolicibacillus koreensis]